MEQTKATAVLYSVGWQRSAVELVHVLSGDFE